MDSIDLEVLKTSAAWVAAGHRAELVTVIKTWGSSPRPIGATLAICDDGRVVGSVSGGCIEDDLIARVRERGITRSTPDIVSYGITADEAHRFGLPCGGTIELAIEPLGAHSRIAELLDMLERRQLVERRLDLETGAVQLRHTTAGNVLELRGGAAHGVPQGGADRTRDNVGHRAIHGELVTQHGPRWRLLIIGAGQLSRFLAQIATAMDYHVTVCDPREEYRAGWQVDGVQLVHAMPDDLVLEMRLDHRSAVVALTHDPKLDDLALMEALKSDAFYVGAIGSRVNNSKRRERLLQFDVSPAQLDRLHGPIGLYIGSKTPAEIAISILAEMTAVKNGVPAALQIKHAASPEAPSTPDAPTACAVT